MNTILTKYINFFLFINRFYIFVAAKLIGLSYFNYH